MISILLELEEDYIHHKPLDFTNIYFNSNKEKYQLCVDLKSYLFTELDNQNGLETILKLKEDVYKLGEIITEMKIPEKSNLLNDFVSCLLIKNKLKRPLPSQLLSESIEKAGPINTMLKSHRSSRALLNSDLSASSFEERLVQKCIPKFNCTYAMRLNIFFFYFFSWMKLS